MSGKKNDYELKNEDLNKVSGGQDSIVKFNCPFCGEPFYVNRYALYNTGDLVSKCSNGHKVYKGSCGYDVKNGDEVRCVYK